VDFLLPATLCSVLSQTLWTNQRFLRDPCCDEKAFNMSGLISKQGHSYRWKQ